MCRTVSNRADQNSCNNLKLDFCPGFCYGLVSSKHSKEKLLQRCTDLNNIMCNAIHAVMSIATRSHSLGRTYRVLMENPYTFSSIVMPALPLASFCRMWQIRSTQCLSLWAICLSSVQSQKGEVYSVVGVLKNSPLALHPAQVESAVAIVGNFGSALSGMALIICVLG